MRYFIIFSILAALLVPVLGAAANAPAAGKPASEGLVSRMTRELNLTDDQQAKIKGSMTAFKTAFDDWAKKNGGQLDKLRTEIQAAEKAGKIDTAQQLRKQASALLNEQVTLQAKYEKEISDVLTPEQRTTWAGVSAYDQGEFALVRQVVKLAPEQETKLKAQAKTYAAAGSKWEAANGEKARQLEGQIRDAQAALTGLLAAREKIEADNHAAVLAILTPAQLIDLTAAQLQEAMAERLGGITLADAQVTKIKALCRTSAAEINKIPDTNRNARRQVAEKLYQTISGQVLTADQRAELKKSA